MSNQSTRESRTRMPARPRARPGTRPGHVIAYLLTAVLLIGLIAVLRVTSAPSRPAAAAGTIFRTVTTSRTPAPASHPAPRRARQALRRAHTASRPATRTYTVRPGDSLSSIARHAGGPSAGWAWLYHANQSRISDPDLIYPGQVLTVPATWPTSSPAPGETTPPTSSPAKATPHRAAGKRGHWTAAAAASAHLGGPALRGTLGCAGLEALWEQAGGSPAQAVTAASIAIAESSGAQYATGGAGERGYWQIHPDHGALSTYDPYGNARAAVIVSANGTNWSPWTTYTSGAYRGRC
jgi:LysM repeat protein